MRSKTLRLRIALAALAVIIPCVALTWIVRSRHKSPPSVRLQVAEPLVLAIFKDQFRCTLYYTPLETGFRADDGFNTKSESRAGLEGREFPHDFLLAVEKEGFGKMREP